jgi:DNA-directed RNA polymerase II subunit RPB2
MINNEWNILDLYFKDHNYPFTGHHLDSYRNFVKIKIPEIIKLNNPITMIKLDDINKNMIVKVEVFVGGEEGDNIYVDRPISFENGAPKLITPNDARMRNLTYETHIFAKIIVKITDDKNVVNNIEFNNIAIGSIPIMLHSDICLLKNNGSDILKLLGECPYDTGGYFIIDGKEKVIIAQENIVTNKLFTSKLKDDDINGFSYKGVIRCVSDKGSVKPFNIEFYYVDTPTLKNGLYRQDDVDIKYMTGKQYRYGSILASLPSFSEKIPLFILFRALGIETDKEIYNYIFGDELDSNEKEYFDNFIRPSIISSFYTFKDEKIYVYTQNDALNYLKHRVKYGSIEHVKSVIMTEIFPNIDELDNKGKYLGYLILQFIKTVIGTIPLSDRDSYIYKRVDISGFKLTELFQESYIKLRDNIRIKIDNEYYYGSYKEKGNYTNIVNNNNIYKIVDSLIITQTFGKSLKGRWGLINNSDPELGIVQDLSRISYIGYLSHLRRVNIPIDRSVKITSPHRLHSQQWGMMCPFESPDGASIGYLKNLSLLTKITAGLNVNNIKKCLLDIGIIALNKFNLLINKNITRVFLNGTLFGYTGDPIFVTRLLKAYRRNGLINILISISWNIPSNEIRIFTEAGRPCRPLLILRKTKTDENEIIAYQNNCTNWFDMLNGKFNKLADEDKNDDYYYRDIYNNPIKTDDSSTIEKLGGAIFNIGGGGKKKNDSDTSLTEHNDNYRKIYKNILKELEENGACIEYLDNEETDTVLIAMNKEEITSYHTHLEIHPSTIFSVVTCNIPMCNHNQAARNVFHAAQSKQAIGIYATNFNKRFDTMSYVLHYPQRAIINTRIAQYTSSDYMANGYNTIVAIMTYSGFNQEDSIMINKGAINRGLNYLSYYKSITATSKIVSAYERIIFGNPIKIKDKLGKYDELVGIKNKDYSYIDDNGFIKKGTYIPQGQEVIIVGMLNVKEIYYEHKEGVFTIQKKKTIYKDVSISTDNSLYGKVDDVYISNKLSGEDSIICKVKFLKIKKPEFGDKHASRHGQKGVIGMIIPEENMPYTKDGVKPDIIINPHAIPSRMTIGHLVECIFAKLCCIEGILGDATVFIPIDNESIYKRLEDNAFNKHGNEILYNGFTGKQIETEIFIGPTYYFRLKHMVAEKINSRGTGKVTGLTRQPTEGRRNGGGLRIGEMERDTLLSHGISMFLQESMMERSDKYAWAACKNCGTLVALNIASNINECKNCNNDDISIVRTPYAFKLLIQEFEAMGVQLRINTEEIDIPSEYIEPYIYKGKITNGEDIVLEEEDEDEENDEEDEVDDVDDVDEKISKMQWKELYDDSFNESDKKKGGYIKKGNNYKREDVEYNKEIKGGDYDSNEDEEVGSEEGNEEDGEEGSEDEEGGEEGYNEYDDVMNGGDYDSEEEDENNKELEGGGKYDIDEDYEYDNEEKNINNKNEEFFGGNDVTDSESDSTASSEEDDDSDEYDEGQEGGGDISDINKSEEKDLPDNGKDFIKIIDILE